MKIFSRIFRSQNGVRWLVAPFLVLLVVFWLLPLIQGGIMSLKPDFPQEGQEYSSLYNYERMLNDKNFGVAVKNTSEYIFWTITIIIPLSLGLAFILMKMVKRLRYFSAFCLLIPALIPPAVIGLLFGLTFSGKTGIINQVFIMPFDGKPINWMSNPNYILYSMVIQSIWRWTGFITLFLLCGLESNPKSVSEAAELEGAGPIRRFFHFDLPAIKHLIFFCMAFLFIDSFSLFSGAYSLLGPSGGTANAGLIMINYAYKATKFQEFNFAAAISMSMLPILMLLTGLLCINWQRATSFIRQKINRRHSTTSSTSSLATTIEKSNAIFRKGVEILFFPFRKILELFSAAPMLLKKVLQQSLLVLSVIPFIAIFSYPILWLVLSCFKPDREMYKPMNLFAKDWKWYNPKAWNWDSFEIFFSDKFANNFSFWTYWNNSMIIAVGQALIAVFISAAAAYFFVFKQFRGKVIIFILAVSLVLIPKQIMIFPLRELIFDMKMHDNLWSVILPGALSGIGVLFFIQIYKNLPRDYVDMARMEGASELKAFTNTIPLLFSAFLCCFMIHFILAWQQHLIPLQLLDQNKTLPVAMSALSSSGGGQRYPVAILLISSLFCIFPPILLFLFTYKKFRSALSTSIC
jgi:arabinosaccharide transport system permease protein